MKTPPTKGKQTVNWPKRQRGQFAPTFGQRETESEVGHLRSYSTDGTVVGNVLHITGDYRAFCSFILQWLVQRHVLGLLNLLS